MYIYIYIIYVIYIHLSAYIFMYIYIYIYPYISICIYTNSSSLYSIHYVLSNTLYPNILLHIYEFQYLG